jgi:hypothetical protein
MKKTFAFRYLGLVLVAAAGLSLATTPIPKGNGSGVLGMVAASPRALARHADTITAPSGTDTTPTTTATKPTWPPAGLVVVNPKVSLSKPSVGVLTSRSAPVCGAASTHLTCAAYRLKVSKPVTWWFSVSDPTGRFMYSLHIFKGATSSSIVGGTLVLFVPPLQSHAYRTFARASWTWQRPPRGIFRVCAGAMDAAGPLTGHPVNLVSGGNDEACQIIAVG